MSLNTKHAFVPGIIIPIQFVDGVEDTALPIAIQLNKTSSKLVDIIVPIRFKDGDGKEQTIERRYTIMANDMSAAATALLIAAKE